MNAGDEAGSAPAIVADPGHVDAAWLTEVLRFAGYDVTVRGVTAERVGTGQVGMNVRFRMEHDGGSDVPVTVVGKFASDDPVSRQTGIALENYLCEVRFYQLLAPTLGIRVPAIFFTDIEPESHDFVVVMEDLAPARQGDQLAGCDLEEAELAVAELAGLHGPRWNDPALLDIPWLRGRDPDGPAQTVGLWQQTFPAFVERYRDRLTADELACARGLDAVFDRYVARRDGPFTVTHGDYRLDNMMFGGPYPLAVVDWQSPRVGAPAGDLAYFMGTGLPPELRRRGERRLVEDYHGRLLARGVDDWSASACWDDYRRASFGGLVMAVIASMIVGQTPRGDDMFMTMYRRSAAMALDLDALGLLR